MHFFCFLGTGLLFLALAVFVGLPTLLLSPSKFALLFSLGCAALLCAFAALKGWRAQLGAMLARDRLPFSAGAVLPGAPHPPPSPFLPSLLPSHAA